LDDVMELGVEETMKRSAIHRSTVRRRTTTSGFVVAYEGVRVAFLW
jgi:hypothetical protein